MRYQQPRDNQRGKLYAAGFEMEGGWTDEFGSLATAEAWLKRFVDSRWYRARWSGRPPTVRAARTRATWRNGVIRLAPRARNRWTILHELAHHIAETDVGTIRVPVASHGPEFAAIYLALVRQGMGEQDAKVLRQAFVRHGVRHRTGAWALPTPSRSVVTKAEAAEQRKLREERTRTDRAKRMQAASLLRIVASAGEFGPAGSKLRTYALKAAKRLEEPAGSAGVSERL